MVSNIQKQQLQDRIHDRNEHKFQSQEACRRNIKNSLQKIGQANISLNTHTKSLKHSILKSGNLGAGEMVLWVKSPCSESRRT